MDTKHNSSEEAQLLNASLENLRSELSYAKNHNADWFEAFLKRLDQNNNQIKSLERSVNAFGWMFLVITVALLATLLLNGVISIPTWESVTALWDADFSQAGK